MHNRKVYHERKPAEQIQKETHHLKYILIRHEDQDYCSKYRAYSCRWDSWVLFPVAHNFLRFIESDLIISEIASEYFQVDPQTKKSKPDNEFKASVACISKLKKTENSI